MGAEIKNRNLSVPETMDREDPRLVVSQFKYNIL